MDGKSQVRPHHKGRRMALLLDNDQEINRVTLVATTLSEYQYSHMESPALGTFPQASVLPSNLQRDITAGPSSHLGLNNGNLYVTQGRKHIYSLMDFGKSDDITGKHIRDGVEVHKLEAGLVGTLFKNNLPIL